MENSKLGKRDSRKEDILKAAVSVFAHKGYYRATTADIAKKASISQPYVYNFFENKEELLIAALKRSWDNILEVFANVQEDSEKIEQQFIVAYEKLMEAHKDEILLQVQALAIREPKIQTVMQEGFRKIKAYVETRFCKAGVVDADRKVINFMARGMLCNISISLDMPDLM
ncbi:MAG: TetR/AcrR family transcriptional regulator [Clostridium sp.]|uniref:TetR/AcrR family transcriptional regulator n=1 Tax=Clostridium sp. TaxID=1506 RepID=UPI0039E9E2C2